MIWLVIVVAVVGILSWIIKMIYKTRLERGLGRKVEDHELTSLTAWMDAEKTPGASSAGEGENRQPR